MTKKNNEQTLDIATHLRFLQCIFEKTNNQTSELDKQFNIVLGIASAVFLYSASKIDSNLSLVFIILSTFSALSVLVSLISIHPPKFLRINNKHESVKSLMGNKRITSYVSSQDYADQLMKIESDSRKITDHFAAAIYNTNVNYYRPKRNLLKLSIGILFTGIALSVATMVFGKIV